jgi:hypothetical protein
MRVYFVQPNDNVLCPTMDQSAIHIIRKWIGISYHWAFTSSEENCTKIWRKYTRRDLFIGRPNIQRISIKNIALSSRMFLTAEENLLKIKREKYEWGKKWKFVLQWKGTRSSHTNMDGRWRWPTGDWRDILELDRHANDDALPADDDGNQKLKKISSSRGFNVTLNSLQTS